MKYYFAWIFLYFAPLLWLIFTLCFSVMQKEPRRQRFFRESRQTILQKSRPNGNLKSIIENPRKKCTYNRNQNCGHFQPHLHFWVNKKKIKTSLWRKIYEMKMWWSHFLFLLQKKYLLTNFTLFIIMLMYEKKIVKNSVRKFSLIFYIANNFSPTKKLQTCSKKIICSNFYHLSEKSLNFFKTWIIFDKTLFAC